MDFNLDRNVFVFTSEGEIFENEKESLVYVKSFGALRPESSDTLKGNAIDIGDRNSILGFRIDAHRVKPSHIRATIDRPVPEASPGRKYN